MSFASEPPLPSAAAAAAAVAHVEETNASMGESL